ncbi:MAG TPA: hypothetical protein VJH06_01560 [Candidatus Paceibacterota bacterium]
MSKSKEQDFTEWFAKKRISANTTRLFVPTRFTELPNGDIREIDDPPFELEAQGGQWFHEGREVITSATQPAINNRYSRKDGHRRHFFSQQ